MKILGVLGKFKKNILFYILSGLGVAVFSALAFVAYGKINEHISKNGQSKLRTVIIDAGHGGIDGGAVGVDGIIEKDINLAIALKLKDLTEASGYDVIMTRDKDESIHDEEAETTRGKKVSDLNNRAKILKDNSKEGAIFVSVHQNKFPESKYFGTQIFYSKENPKSLELANSIKDSVVGLLQPDNSREIKPAGTKIFLLNNTDLPAVVVECGFLSNEIEAKKLVTEEYQSEMAFSVFCGITNYFINNS